MTSVSSILKRMLGDSGFSQRELARRAGMSHASLVAYSKERQDPGLATLQRLADAANCELFIEVRPRLTPSELRTLEYHRLIAEKLESNPQRVLEVARRNLDALRRNDRNGNSMPYFDAWQSLLDGSSEDLTRVLLSTDSVARDLRQASPFSGVLSDEERLDALMRTDGARIANKMGRPFELVRSELLAKIAASGRNLRDEGLVSS
jgi:transcriptional regulator with XRE-family HTH domain